MLILIQKS